MSAQVQILTFLSETHMIQGRYAVSIDVTPRKKTDSVKKKRKTEEQVYVEYGCVVGSSSPEFELTMKNKKCEIQFSVSGALKHSSVLEQGEDIIEYNSSLSECRRLLSLVPTFDESAEGSATIKFKVDGNVKHTVTIHDVPMSKYRRSSASSSSSSFAEVSGPERQMSYRSTASSSCRSIENLDLGSPQSTDDTINIGSARENISSASGEGYWSSEKVEAVPVPPRDSLDERMGNMAIRKPVPDVPDVLPAEDTYPYETAYDKMLCNESLSTLSWALSPGAANRLLIALSVPNHVLSQNQKNHSGDVVTANYESFRYWRSQRKSTKQTQESSNQFMYEDLLTELDDIGRKDLKVVLKRALEENKKLEKKDFNHL